MAQAKWCKNNTTTNIPSYNEQQAMEQEAQNKIIEAIQLEQDRVYKQDLRLLKGLSSQDGADVSSIGENSKINSYSLKDIHHEHYEMKQLEDDLIRYICEKIIAMREQPFIDAVDNLRRAQELNNLQMIMNLQKQKQAKLAQHSVSTSQGFNSTNLSQMHKNLFNQAQDNFTISDDKVNGVTFKQPPVQHSNAY
jgi:hypothetical protein